MTEETQESTAAEQRGFEEVPEPTKPTESAPVQESPSVSMRETIEKTVLVITLVVLALAILVFLIAVNQIIEVWLRHQWVPIARAVTALGVAGLCLYVLVRLTRHVKA